MEQEREEALSKQAVLQVQKYEGEKGKESNVDEIIQKALRKKIAAPEVNKPLVPDYEY